MPLLQIPLVEALVYATVPLSGAQWSKQKVGGTVVLIGQWSLLMMLHVLWAAVVALCCCSAIAPRLLLSHCLLLLN
jgi:hypothetical protein